MNVSRKHLYISVFNQRQKILNSDLHTRQADLSECKKHRQSNLQIDASIFFHSISFVISKVLSMTSVGSKNVNSSGKYFHRIWDCQKCLLVGIV